MGRKGEVRSSSVLGRETLAQALWVARPIATTDKFMLRNMVLKDPREDLKTQFARTKLGSHPCDFSCV